MIDDATLDSASRRLTQALAPPERHYRPLRVAGSVAGWIRADRADRIAAFSDVFCANSEGIEFVPALGEPAARNRAVAQVAAQLAREGALTAWRDERYAVAAAFGAPPWFELERAAARYFGVHTWAAHVNGLVREHDRVWMGFARRSPQKAIDPGMLDNLVGGGIAAGATVDNTVVKEAWEEAGIPAASARQALSNGSVNIRRDQPDGLHWETIFVHDLWLPEAFAPANQDGEAVEHRRVALSDAARLIANDHGPDVVTADASLVVVDCLLRLSVVPHSSASFTQLSSLRCPPS